MKNKEIILCEIIFKDHKLGVITSRIGRIHKSQLSLSSLESNGFIIFKEKYNSPILKSDITDIIIHQDDRIIDINKVTSGFIKHSNSQNKGKIS